MDAVDRGALWLLATDDPDDRVTREQLNMATPPVVFCSVCNCGPGRVHHSGAVSRWAAAIAIHAIVEREQDYCEVIKLAQEWGRLWLIETTPSLKSSWVAFARRTGAHLFVAGERA